MNLTMGRNNLTKLNEKVSCNVERLFKKTSHMALVGLRQIKEELCNFF